MRTADRLGLTSSMRLCGHLGNSRNNLPDTFFVGLAVVVMGIVTVPRLPSGICYGDSGGLQLAAATLGITHPPGYAGYVSLAYLATLVPGVSPAYMVSLACLGTGLVTLLLCILMQVRLGVAPALACSVALALTAHPRIWSNLIVPEVYMPSLACLAGAAYVLTKYAQSAFRRDLFIAALLFGLALANRPPVVLTLPFFLSAWWLAERRVLSQWPRAITSVLVASMFAALPTVYTLGYLWVRDTPQTPYNYIEQYNDEFHELPDSDTGSSDKFVRIVWHATAQQFRSQLGNTWPGVRGRLVWLRSRLLPDNPVASVIVLIFVFVGVVVVYRRCQVSALLLAGIGIASIVFICVYRVGGNAADFLPLLFAAAVCGGVALSSLFSRLWARRHRLAAVIVFVFATVFTLIDAPRRFPAGQTADASPYVEGVDLATLPANAVICSTWPTSCPLWYAKHVLVGRSDIDIINTGLGKWRHIIERTPHRPVFTTIDLGSWGDVTSTPFRNLWRVAPSPNSRGGRSG